MQLDPLVEDLIITSEWRPPKCGSHMPIPGIYETLADLYRTSGWPGANTCRYEAAYETVGLGQNFDMCGKTFPIT